MDSQPIKKRTWAEVNPATMRLTGNTKLLFGNETGPNGWYPLTYSIMVMLNSETKTFKDYAVINNHIVEVPQDIDLRFLSHISSKAWPDIIGIDYKWTKVPWLPLDIPKLEPDDWDLFWKLWDEKSGDIGRASVTEQQMWKGLAIWKRDDVDESKFNYQAETYDDWSIHFPKMFEQIKTCMPWLTLEKVVLWSNVNEIKPHFDPDYVMYPWPDSLRVMLWDTNDKPTFYVTPWPQRSKEFDPPIVDVKTHGTGYGFESDLAAPDDRMYVNLPPDTNSFVFNNGAFVHGADLAKPKIIMAIKGRPDISKWLRVLNSSYEKYKEYLPNIKEQTNKT